jgi:clan AA aspartic protease (TIGR02281 family)
MQKNVIMPLVLKVLLISSMNAWGETMIFKCKNPQGAMIYQKAPCNETTETVTSWAPATTSRAVVPGSDAEKDKNSQKEPSPVLKLKQNGGGHYTTEGSINDKSLNFVVDTGASYVSLPEAIAHSALIYCDDQIGMNTANGKADACTAKIKKLQFGPFLIQDAAAVIVPNLDQPLLGMNILQLFKVGQENGEMHISIQDKTKTTEQPDKQ